MTNETGNGNARNPPQNNNNRGIGGIVETSRAEKAVWLMKCPALVSHSFQKYPSSSAPSDDSSRPVAKVILSIDPLNSSDDNSSRQFTMELTDSESGNAPKSYSMDMTEDFIPMSVFSESSQGKIGVEGKILHKFDMRPHNENLENYAKICRERTKKYMTKGRQIQSERKKRVAAAAGAGMFDGLPDELFAVPIKSILP